MVADMYYLLNNSLRFVFLVIPLFPNCTSKVEPANHNYYPEIVDASIEFNIDPILILAVIRGEQANGSIIDKSQDAFFEAKMDAHNNEWWQRWVLKNKAIANSQIKLRSEVKKWTVDLYQSGFVSSYGIGQITPRALMNACEFYNKKNKICSKCSKDVLKKLTQPTEAIYLIGLMLRYEIDTWKNWSSYDIEKDPILILTLYNLGCDIYKSRYQNNDIVYNKFGCWYEINWKVLKNELNSFVVNI